MARGYESNRWTAQDLEKLLHLAAKGLSAKTIAIRLGRTISAVQSKAKKEGIVFGAVPFDRDCNPL